MSFPSSPVPAAVSVPEEPRPILRNKTVSTKLSEGELEEVEVAAQQAGKSFSEWARETLLRSARGTGADPAAEAALGEVLALRAVLLNLLYASNQGRQLTQEEMQTLIVRADQEKNGRAAQVLEEKGRKGKSHGPAL